MGKWVRRIEEAGLGPLLVPLLELTRALGPLIAQALLLGHPLLSGVISSEALEHAADWLDDSRGAEQLLGQLERRSEG